jgi:hypothetical protein
MFVWNGLKANHHNMIEYLVQRKQMKPVEDQRFPQYSDHLLNGFCEITSGYRLKYTSSDDTFYMEQDQARRKFKNDWSWAKPYMIGFDKFMKEVKDNAEGKNDGEGQPYFKNHYGSAGDMVKRPIKIPGAPLLGRPS